MQPVNMRTEELKYSRKNVTPKEPKIGEAD